MACLKKFTLEFPIKSSIKILYEFISTPEGLSEWFAEEITVNNGIMTFKWYDSEIRGKLLTKKDNEFVRFQWLDAHDHPAQYLEIKINIEPVTGDMGLVITDFCLEEEIEDQKELWEMSFNNLMRRIGGH